MSSGGDRDAWKYINPSLATEPELPSVPQEPTAQSVSDKTDIVLLTVEERELYKLKYQSYRTQLSSVTRTLETIVKI